MKFRVAKHLKIIKFEAINGVTCNPSFEQEVVRFLESMPPWFHASKNGKIVEADYQLTVPFNRLAGNKRIMNLI